MNCFGSTLMSNPFKSGTAVDAMDGTTDVKTTATPKQWKKRFLLPIWTTQFISFAIWFALGIYMFTQAGTIVEPVPSDAGLQPLLEDLPQAHKTELRSIGAALVVVSFSGILLTLVELTLYAFKRLHPVWALISSIFKFILAGNLPTAEDPVTSLFGDIAILFWVVAGLVEVASLLELIYTAIATHRWRRARRNARNGLAPTPPLASNAATPQATGAPPMSTTAHNAV
ncbi:hypothetical protein Q7P37_002742 [Cladosporium fusiforme]